MTETFELYTRGYVDAIVMHVLKTTLFFFRGITFEEKKRRVEHLAYIHQKAMKGPPRPPPRTSQEGSGHTKYTMPMNPENSINLPSTKTEEELLEAARKHVKNDPFVSFGLVYDQPTQRDRVPKRKTNQVIPTKTSSKRAKQCSMMDFLT